MNQRTSRPRGAVLPPRGISGVYTITCLPTGRRYVGSSREIRRRFREHRNMLRLGTHCNRKLQRAWNKHGEESFAFAVVAEIRDKDERLAAEQAMIDAEQACTLGLNLAPKVESPAGIKWTPETRAKMDAAWTPERRQKIRDTHSGERNLFSRLSDDAATEIMRRLAAGEKGCVLAREYGVSDAAISAIRRGKVRRGAFDPAVAAIDNRRNMTTITLDQVREVKRLLRDGCPGTVISPTVGISEGMISLIKNGHRYPDVTIEPEPLGQLTFPIT